MKRYFGHAPLLRRLLAMTLAAGALAASGSALAVLELRDINGHPTANSADAEFAYDTLLDATWYLTGNNSRLDWDAAKGWAAGLTVGTFEGWSLPSTNESCFGFCSRGQMGELYYKALGNKTPGLSNTGPFKNLLKSLSYWLGTEVPPNPERGLSPGLVWVYSMGEGVQAPSHKYVAVYALAIRPGDVAPVAVPEPGTIALLLSGLGAVTLLSRRRALRPAR